MKSKIYLLLFFAFFLTVNSCKDVEEPDLPPIIDNPDPDPDPINLPTQNIVVSLPSGSGVDLSAARIYANTFDFPVAGDGSSKIVLQPGASQLTFLLDTEDRLLMAGFINSNKTELSIASTAEVLFYFGNAGFLLPSEFREKYIKESSSIAALTKFREDLEALFVQNPISLSQGSFVPKLEAALADFNKGAEEIDIRARQINLDPTGVKSGIQLADVDFQSIIIRNRYRRRAHAFIYKTSFKDKDGNETILKSNIGGADVADSDKGIDPTGSVSGFLGTVADGLMGNGMQFAVTETESINIPLAATESEATYAVRVIGAAPPHRWNDQTATLAEKEKWESLLIETVFMDMILPIISEVFSFAGDNAGSEEKALLAEAIKLMADFAPFYKELFETGDLKKFVTDFIKYFASDAVTSAIQDKMAEILAKRALGQQQWGIDLDRKYNEEVKKMRFLNVMKYVDMAITGADFLKMIGEITVSQPLERFQAKAIEHDINLIPKESSVTVFTNKDFTVETKTELSDGQAFLYKWSTSGTYGTIRDNFGNNGTAFENGQKTVIYRAESSNIPDDAKETIKVEAFVKQGPNETKIGEATATVSVKPARLEIKPDGVTLQGKEKQSLALYVEWANGDAFENTNSFEYRYEWSSSERHGNFIGSNSTDEPRIIYQATDEDVAEGEEDLSVDIYMRRKDGGEWFKYHTAEGKVNIDNDEKLKILHLPLTVFTSYGTNNQHGGGTNFLHASFPKNDEYESFTVRFYGYRRTTIPSSEGLVFSWKAENNPPVRIDLNGQVSADRYIDKIPDNLIAIYYLTNSASSGTRVPELAASLQTFGGQVEVKIRLK